MKNIFYGVLIILISTNTFAQKDSAFIKSKSRLGVFSPDSENEGGEKDASFASMKFSTATQAISPGANKMFLRNHAQAQEIAEKAGKWLDNLEFTVALLPQHKYMINDCLGIKASVGEYKINVGMPFIKVDENGIVITFRIDKLEDNKVTVRTRPCYKDGQCHFSLQLAIGGTMTDLRLEISINPVMDLQTCKIISIGMPHIKWRIGGLNYKPLQNDLDAMVKNMMEDALTFASELIMPGRIAEAFNLVEMGGSNCGLPKVESTGQGATSSTASTAAWEIKDNAQLKGSTGRLLLSCEGAPHIVTHIYNAGAPRYFDAWYKCNTGSFIPGNYDLTINGVKVQNVPIEKGRDTRIKLGILSTNIASNGGFQVLDMSGKKVYNNYGNKKVALPVGQYKIAMQGKEMTITIEDLKQVDF